MGLITLAAYFLQPIICIQLFFYHYFFFTHEELEDDLSYNVVKTGIKFQKSKQL